MSDDIFEEKYKNNQLSSFERKLFEAYYPYKERCEELAESLHKEEIHRISVVQEQQLEIQTLQKENSKLREALKPVRELLWENGLTMEQSKPVIEWESKHKDTLKELRSNDEPLGSELEGGK